jgi:hypothetical protein
VRKPTVLSILEGIFEHGVDTTTTGFARQVRGLAQKPWTAREIARALLDELEYAEYAAAEHNPDDDGKRSEEELARFRKLEREVRDRRAMMWEVVGGPTGDRASGDTEGFLLAETARYRQRAIALRDELGDRFLRGSWEVRAAMVRDWIRNYREQGRLPTSEPPRTSH